MLNWCERWAPALSAAIAIGVALVMRARGWDAAAAEQVEFTQIVSVTFNIVAFATPVTVALFAITLAPGGGFIQKLFGTQTYALFVDYVIAALVLGGFALLASAPFLIAKADSATAQALAKAAPIWWAAASAALVAIGRVLLIFLIWARSYSQPKRVTESREGLSGATAQVR